MTFCSFWAFLGTFPDRPDQMSSYPGRGPQIKDVRKQTELICPPLPPTWGDFFSSGHQKRHFVHKAESSAEVDDDGGSDNFDDSYGNFDED